MQNRTWLQRLKEPPNLSKHYDKDMNSDNRCDSNLLMVHRLLELSPAKIKGYISSHKLSLTSAKRIGLCAKLQIYKNQLELARMESVWRFIYRNWTRWIGEFIGWIEIRVLKYEARTGETCGNVLTQLTDMWATVFLNSSPWQQTIRQTFSFWRLLTDLQIYNLVPQSTINFYEM